MHTSNICTNYPAKTPFATHAERDRPSDTVVLSLQFIFVKSGVSSYNLGGRLENIFPEIAKKAENHHYDRNNILKLRYVHYRSIFISYVQII